MSRSTRNDWQRTIHSHKHTMAAWLLLACVSSSLRGHADEALADPTRPPTVVTRTVENRTTDVPEPLSLQAIFFADGRRVAIINDQRLGEDDIVEAARIVSIDRNSVRLERGAELLELRLVPSSIKRERGEAPPRSTRAPSMDEASPASLQQGTPP